MSALSQGITRHVVPALALAIFMGGDLALAKRGAAAKVDPIVHDGMRYSVPNDNGRRAYLVAWDVRADKKAWDLTVFTNAIDPNLEEDVQWVFIKQMKLKEGKLVVTSETDKSYQIDPAKRTVTPLK